MNWTRRLVFIFTLLTPLPLLVLSSICEIPIIQKKTPLQKLENGHIDMIMNNMHVEKRERERERVRE